MYDHDTIMHKATNIAFSHTKGENLPFKTITECVLFITHDSRN